MLKTTIQGTVPSKSNSYRIARNRLFKSKELTAYEKIFDLQCKIKNKNIKWFELYLDVYYPNNRSDLDGCLKVILDCLQKSGTVENDNKCVLLLLTKHIDKINPRVEIFVNPVPGIDETAFAMDIFLLKIMKQ